MRPSLAPALALAGLCAFALPACSQQAAGPEASSQAPDDAGAAAGDSTPAARFDGSTLSVGEVDAFIKDELFRRATDDGDAMKTWTVRRDAVSQLIDERLLEEAAAAAGLTPEALLRDEMAKRNVVSDAEVQAFYDENQERIGRPLAEIEDQVRRHLEQRNAQSAQAAYFATLREGRHIEILIDAPRISVAATGPALGPDDAPVTIVEFSDYQCPFCRRVEPTVKALLERYPQQVRLVYRHYPLDRIHPQARGASEAAACAHDQDRFWQFHEKLFQEGARLDADSLVAYAEEAGADVEAFRACVDERRHKDLVQADFEAGAAAGVTGTPAFFVNGIRLSGAQPLEEFVRLVEEELAGS